MGYRLNSRDRRRLSDKTIAMIVIFGVIVAAAAGGSVWLYISWHSGPVPKTVKAAVSFPIYYPDQHKLPNGYHLDESSFSTPVKNGASYTVNYEGTKKVVFSVQAKPSDDELQAFKGNYIPLRIDYQTSLGQAEIGSYQSQTLVSLPIINGPWVIITAPLDINQTQLKQVIDSLTK